MNSCTTFHVGHERVLSEIVQGLHEYQVFLVNSAGMMASKEFAQKLYDLAGQHSEMESQLRELALVSCSQEAPIASPFLNQIRTLSERLRKFGELDSSRHVLCEIIQTEERMIRRFRILIDQVSDSRWRRRLNIQLNRLLDMRESLGKFRDARGSLGSSSNSDQQDPKPPYLNRLN